ncbi:GNAT family N-acetyltransferase, partial [Azoarcus taiwanensis]|nr:GNAT family N-acetyltransferase [Azoarcus taiwanensis]
MDEPRICIADWHEARDKVMPVRETVFVQEQGVPPEIELDEADPTCRHAMAITRD